MDKKIYFSEPTTVITNAVGGGGNNIKNGDSKSSILSKIHKIFRSLKKLAFTAKYSDILDVPTALTQLINAYNSARVRIFADSEGGNIIVWSRSGTLKWQQDSYDDNRYRIFCIQNGKVTSQYFFQKNAPFGNVLTDTMLNNMHINCRLIRNWTKKLQIQFKHDSMGFILIGKYTDLSAYAVLLVYVVLRDSRFTIATKVLHNVNNTLAGIGGPTINASTGLMTIIAGAEVEFCYIGT